MMDVNAYLTKLSKQLEVGDSEISKIQDSISNLKTKIWGKFQENLVSVEPIGSFDRQTMLSRSVDKESDVDILVIFKSGEYQPQTYLNWLKEFSEKNYSRSEISPDFPTIAIDMNHIRFELVPAYKNGQLKIPAPRSKEIKWITTDPLEFKQKVENKNKNNGQLILPIIRIFKYWNCLNNYPFTSFYLENFIVTHSYSRCYNLRDYFFEVINDLDNTNFDKSLESHVNNLYRKRLRLQGMEKEKLIEYMEQELQTFIPLLV
jgi:Second Messenger Oligonucleotide or Dinucleotide Synthetase domain